MATLQACRGLVVRQVQLRAAWARCLSHSQPLWAEQNATPGEGKATEAGNPAEGGGDGPAEVDLTAVLQEKEAQIAALQKDIEDNRLRALADKENLRKAKDNEIAKAKDFGISKFSKDLLEVADTVGLAIQHAPMEEVEKKVAEGAPPPPAKVMYEGLVSINQILLKTFGKHGITQINPPVGTELDPHTMQALFEMEAPDQEPGTVALVQQIGYSLNSRVLRPSMVGVVRKSA